ncbi:hypothetical protein [Streptomyces kurssanovii]|uniref:DNA primase/polymerase bifunctional N-terminal domain-containing protein n=1 Tax=Streptomyces kurssanovii TaxID=67312 RepID=A0ABV3HUS7_9ACTN
MTDSTTEAAMEWLASVAPDPLACRRAWEINPFQALLLPAGKLWDVLLVPSRIGYPAFDVLAHRIDAPGPVLADLGGTRTGFFVPRGTTEHWVGTGTRGAGLGTWIVVPCPGRAAGGMRWLVPADGTGTLNDPVLLEHALHEAAARLAERDTGS